MALSLVTNLSAQATARFLHGNQDGLVRSMNRLSSGHRINSARDDAAGLGVAQGLQAEIRSLAQAERNSMDGLSIIQTIDGALGEMSDMLIRMRELTVQASSDGITDQERDYLNVEFVDLRSEIDRVVASTDFSGTSILQSGSLDIATESDGSALTITLPNMTTTTLGVNTAEIDTKANAGTSMGLLDTAMEALNNTRSGLGSKANILVTRHSNVAVQRENLVAAKSRIMDADIAAETATVARQQILVQAGVAMMAQANRLPELSRALLPG